MTTTAISTPSQFVTTASVSFQLHALANEAFSTVSQSVGYLSGIIPQGEGHGVNPSTASLPILEEVTSRVAWLEQQLRDYPILALSVDLVALVKRANDWIASVAYYATERAEYERSHHESRRRIVSRAQLVINALDSVKFTDPFVALQELAQVLTGEPVDLEPLRTRYETDRTIAEIHQLQRDGDFIFGADDELTDEQMSADARHALGKTFRFYDEDAGVWVDAE